MGMKARCPCGCYNTRGSSSFELLARWCGLSPCHASSGARQADAGLVKAAHPALRAGLLEAGPRLAQHDPRWRAFGPRRRRAGKPGRVVAAAVANRGVRWLFPQLPPAA